MAMKICKTCEYFKRVYRKFYNYWGDDKFLCSAKEIFTEKENYCDSWKKKSKGYDLSAKRFDEAEEDVNTLLKLFPKL